MAWEIERLPRDGVAGGWRVDRRESAYQPVGPLAAALSGAGDAITFGWGDELQGALFGEAARDAARARQERARAEHGGAFLAGQIGGSLLGGGVAGAGARAALRGGSALARAAQNIGPMGRIAVGAGAGAAGGAAYGAGDAGDEVRSQAALEGALWGAPLGAFGQAAGEVGGRILGAGGRALSSEARAGREIARLQERFGVDPQGLRHALAEAPDNAMVSDVVPGFTSLVRDAGVRPSAGREALREAFDARNNAMGARAAEDLRRTLTPGRPTGAFDAVETLATEQRRMARPLYERAMDRPVDPRRAENMLGEIVRRNPRLFGEGLRDAEALMLSEHGTRFNRNDPRFWHYLQQGADQVFERLRKQQGGLSGNERRVYGRALDAYRIQLRRLLGPEFGRAQDVWSGYARQRAAVERGFEAASSKADDIDLGELRAAMRRMTPGERELMRVGAVARLTDALQNADTGSGRADVLRSVLRNQGQRRVLETLFGGEDGFNALIRRLDQQRDLFRNSVDAGIGVNSHTAERMVGAEALRRRTSLSPGGLRDRLLDVLTGDAADRYDEAVSNHILQQARMPARQALAEMDAAGGLEQWARGRGLLSAAERQRQRMRASRPRRLTEALTTGLYAPTIGGGLAAYGGL